MLQTNVVNAPNFYRRHLWRSDKTFILDLVRPSRVKRAYVFGAAAAVSAAEFYSKIF